MSHKSYYDIWGNLENASEELTENPWGRWSIVNQCQGRNGHTWTSYTNNCLELIVVRYNKASITQEQRACTSFIYWQYNNNDNNDDDNDDIRLQTGTKMFLIRLTITYLDQWPFQVLEVEICMSRSIFQNCQFLPNFAHRCLSHKRLSLSNIKTIGFKLWTWRMFPWKQFP